MHTDEDRARFLTFLPDAEEQLAQLEADGEITTAREIAFVVPAPEMMAQGMPPFAVLPVRMVRELCTKTASPMPAPPTPGSMLVLVPHIAADGAPALRSFSHSFITAAEIEHEARVQSNEVIERASSTDIEALRLAASEWTSAVRVGDVMYRVLRLDAFDVVIRSDDHTTTCVRRSADGDTAIVRRMPVDAVTARVAADVRSHFELNDKQTRMRS